MANEAQLNNPMIPNHPEITAQINAAQAASPGGPPAAQPNTNGAQPPRPAADPAAIDWSALMLGDDPHAAAPPAAAAAPAAQPAQAQPQPQELTPEQKIELARAAAEQNGQPPQTPGQPPVDPQAAVNQAVNHLLATTYKLTDEQKRKLISEPDVAIPQLAANLHVQVATQLAQYMHQALPGLVSRMALETIQKQMGAMRAEQGFFGKYPSLNNPAFRPVILQCLQYAKQLNPGATREKIMEEAAGMAAWKLKVNLQPPAGAPAPSAPARPAAPAANPMMLQAPFTPASAGAAVPAQAGAPATNMWEELANDTSWP